MDAAASDGEGLRVADSSGIVRSFSQVCQIRWHGHALAESIEDVLVIGGAPDEVTGIIRRRLLVGRLLLFRRGAGLPGSAVARVGHASKGASGVPIVDSN